MSDTLKALLGDERQATYCNLRDLIRSLKGAFTKKTVCDLISQQASKDNDWKLATKDEIHALRAPQPAQDARELLQDALKGLRILRDIGRSRSSKPMGSGGTVSDWGQPIVEACDSVISKIEDYMLRTAKIVQSVAAPATQPVAPAERNKQVPEETVSSPEHKKWLTKRRKQDPLNPQSIDTPSSGADARELAEKLHKGTGCGSDWIPWAVALLESFRAEAYKSGWYEGCADDFTAFWDQIVMASDDKLAVDAQQAKQKVLDTIKPYVESFRAETLARAAELVKKWRSYKPQNRAEVNADYWDGVNAGRSMSASELEAALAATKSALAPKEGKGGAKADA